MRCYRSKGGPTAYPDFIRQRSAVPSDNRRLKVDGDASANPDSAQLAHPKMASLNPSYHSWAMCALCLLLTECVELVANQ